MSSAESETTFSVTELLRTRDRGVSERSQDGRMPSATETPWMLLAVATFDVPSGVVIGRYSP